LKIILLDQKNYVELLSIDDNAAKNFNTLAPSLSILRTIRVSIYLVCDNSEILSKNSFLRYCYTLGYYIYYLEYFSSFLRVAVVVYGKNDFAENLVRYRFENNFIPTIKIIRMFKLGARVLKFFAALSSILKSST